MAAAGVTFHNSDYDLWDAWLHKIYESTQQENWFMPVEETVSTGAVRKLNPVVAVKIRNTAVQAAIAKIGPDEDCLYIDSNTRIQILDTIDLSPWPRKTSAAPSSIGAYYPIHALLARRARRRPLELQPRDHDPLCKEFEEKLIKHIWRTRDKPSHHRATPSVTSGAPSGVTAASVVSPDGSQTALNEKAQQPDTVVRGEEVKAEQDSSASSTALAPTGPAPPPAKRSWWSWKLDGRPPTAPPRDAEKGGKRKERKLVLIGPVYAGLGAGLAAYFMTSGIAVLLEEYALDHDPTRFALIVTLPVIYCVSIFFCLQLIGNICLILGPVAQYHENSMFYSAVKPDPNPEVDRNLPHITIQLPVYKESLELTIAPSVYSVKKAMQTYARQADQRGRPQRAAGVLREPQHRLRRAPGAHPAPGGFKRAGKFKKASNMNYGLALSLKLETFLAQLEAAGRGRRRRRRRVFGGQGDEAGAGGAVRGVRGTVHAVDCFRDAAREMYESPDVAIIQHESDVMQVAHHYFENGITHFTQRINKCISLGCANGEVAPFVGHNAFLRWSAVQDAAFVDPADGQTRQWSEANVSEDFDLALRLLLKGYTLRWATYSNGGFKEGVSLTVVDELARWQKYAYGCNEIIFNPFIKWWKAGPISPQLRGFVWSKAPLHYKVGMMSLPFFLEGGCDRVVTPTHTPRHSGRDRGLGDQLPAAGARAAAGPVLPAQLRDPAGVHGRVPRGGEPGVHAPGVPVGQRNFFAAMFENLRWIPFFLFFFGGMSIHLSTALLAHLFSYDMTWGSTGKEVELSSFWIEVPRIWKRFKLSFVICFACIAMMVVFTTELVPFEWQIPGWNWALIIPLALVVGCHILVPIVLNPWLMIFSY
ncbi:glycosyl transferase family group 2-domain-containing protein [Pholiota molesta]|nr:glycosyl transferase family group 2-domain-containing protein [Pholiota molesta]